MSAHITSGFGHNRSWRRPMWNTAPIAAGSGVTATVRPPDQVNAPLVGDVTGLGTGGGVGLGANCDSAFGNIRLRAGVNPSASGSLTLTWPVAPPAAANGISFAADWATIAQATGGAASLDLNFMTTPGTLPAGVTLSRPSIATYVDATGIVQTAANNIPRWDYDPVSHALNGLLIEEQRINLATQSGDFTQALWTKANCTLAAGTPGPNGAATGSGVIGTGAPIPFVQQSQAVTAGTTYTLSCFAKAARDTLSGILIPSTAWADATNRAATFNLANGTVVSVTGGGASAAIQPFGNGWYRCSMTFTPDTSVTAGMQYFRGAASGDGVSVQCYAWGAQLEAGTFPTSYIPVTAAAVTRSGDFYDLTPLGAWFSSPSAFTQSAEFMSYNPCTAGGGFSRFDDGTANNAVGFVGFQSTPPTIGPAQYSGGTLNWSPAGPSYAYGMVHKAAVTNVAVGAAWAMDGILQVASGTPPAPVPVGLNRLRIGNWGTGVARVLNGYMRRLIYWPRVLSTYELMNVTAAAPGTILALTLNWTATRPLLPNETVRLAYQWNTSN